MLPAQFENGSFLLLSRISRHRTLVSHCHLGIHATTLLQSPLKKHPQSSFKGNCGSCLQTFINTFIHVLMRTTCQLIYIFIHAHLSRLINCSFYFSKSTYSLIPFARCSVCYKLKIELLIIISLCLSFNVSFVGYFLYHCGHELSVSKQYCKITIKKKDTKTVDRNRGWGM